MVYIIIALVSSAFHGLANVIDSHFSNRLFKSLPPLIFFATTFNLLFLPLIFLIDRPQLISLHVIPLIAGIAVAELAYLIPYYKALQHDDTSVVVSLFSLGQLFVPLLAYIFLREQLSVSQYMGVGIIIVSATAVSMRSWRMRPGQALPWMLLTSLILAAESVLYKQLFDSVSWVTGFAWSTFVCWVLGLFILFVPRFRREIAAYIRKPRTWAHLFILEEFLTFAGTAGFTFSISKLPVTIVESLAAVQPFWVVLYAYILPKKFRDICRETRSAQRLVLKVVCFVSMIVGIMLLT